MREDRFFRSAGVGLRVAHGQVVSPIQSTHLRSVPRTLIGQFTHTLPIDAALPWRTEDFIAGRTCVFPKTTLLREQAGGWDFRTRGSRRGSGSG